MARIGFIGGGKMAEAIVSSLLESGSVARNDVIVGEIDEARAADLQQRLGIAVTRKPEAVLAGCDTVFLCVKPQDLDGLMASIGQDVGDHLILSIAAGKRLETLAAGLPGARLVRVMPNIAAMAGA
ncbi:MAG: NAD(P)-binding domain-containing protein, partial [Verrucomicrobia bacterium]|nr:NAD(P)-binding domain-containing protein [Verrucomicrobiota bacterium]